MTWRLAKSLETLREQIDGEWPHRSRISDGTIGDAAHATRTSDHNPWVPPPSGGVVTAVDITHDPAHGADMHKVAEALRRSKDPRIKYVIWDADDATGMFSSYANGSTPAWTWRSYSGINLHTAHMHLSVQPTSYDNVKSWDIGEERDWFSMATKAELREIVKEVVEAEMDKQRKLLAVGGRQQDYDPDRVNLREILKK